MANIDEAILYVLSWEDSTLSGAITTASDGKRTRFGIDEHWHPELAASLFYTSMGAEAALIIAKNLYATQYCEPLCIVDISNQDIANKLLSLGVNIGVRPAGKLLQDVLMVPCDGRIGPITLLTLAQADPLNVLAGMRIEAERYYEKVVAESPDKAVFLDDWLRRAAA